MLCGYWEEDGFWIPGTPERVIVFLAELLPRPMRRWPVFRHWYWQQEEIDEIKSRAAERARAIQRWTQ